MFPRLFTLLLSLSSLSLAACQAPRMAVPADIAAEAELLPVTNRGSATGSWADESFNVGPYRVADVDRKGETTKGLSLGGFGSATRTSGYSFKFTGPDGEARGQCAAELVAQDASALGGSVSSRAGKLGCNCQGTGASGELLLQSGTSSPLQGQATVHGWVVNVVALDRYEGGTQSLDPTGFEARAGVVAGAVEVLRPGRVWLARPLDASRRAGLACLFAGLLLYQPPRDPT
jgi:hypothetical protein